MESSVERRPQRLAIAFILCCLLALSFSWFGPQATLSQGWAQPAEGEGEQPKEEQPAPAPSGSSPNMFIHMVKSVGIFMGIILGFLQISMVALIVLLFMDLRLGDSVPPSFVEEFTDVVNKRRFKEAYELARQDASFLARALTAGMSRLQYGLDDAREIAMNTVASIRAGKETLTSYLAVIGSLGPLIGLVGTVYSMIGAFMKMSDANNPAKPSDLAGTLSHGLVVTLLGIGLAVPAIFFNQFFRNRITRISTEVANVADDLLTQMYHNSRRPASPAAAPSADARTAASAVKSAE